MEVFRFPVIAKSRHQKQRKSIMLSDKCIKNVRVLVGKGLDALSIRAVLNGVPERAHESRSAFEYASRMTPVEIDVCRDEFADELDRRLAQAAVIAARFRALEGAMSRTKAIEPSEVGTSSEIAAERPKRKTIAGIPVTAAIRFLAAEECSAAEISQAIKAATGEDVHPSTLQIQMRRAEKGDIPKLDAEQAKALRAIM